MTFTPKQLGVLAGMIAGLLISALVLWLAVRFGSAIARDTLLSIAFLGPAATLFFAIARLARYRFFSPEDIDGSALTRGTERARLLQALLQNTLEQLALALPVYALAFFMAPTFLISMAAASGALFVLGRVLFFAAYRHGAVARSLGFALTFYPAGLLLLAEIVCAATKAG